MLINDNSNAGFVDGGDDGGIGGGSGGGGVRQSLPSLRQPTMLAPPKGVRESGLPPFLLKTYAIVDDPNTNSIISWSLSGTSFIVWNHLKMAAEILPTLFRHSNFSSFVYQLNSYRFRKIGLEQWEYENEWFQAGKKHLLTNIKRRDQISRIIKPRGRRQLRIDPPSCDMEAELDNLESVVKMSKVEIQKLKQQQQDVENQIEFFKEQMKIAESKSQRLVMFFAKALGRTFLQVVIQLIGEGKELGNGETGKKRKLLAPESTENAAKNSDMQTLQSANDSTGTNQEQERDNATAAATASRNSQDYAFWEKLLEDDSCETEAERELARQQSKIDMELDDIIACRIAEEVIAKPTDLDAEEEINIQLWA